jgi:hypothetical protein
VHYFLTYFTTNRPENYFNTNFEIVFTYSFNTDKLKDLAAMPVTVSNYNSNDDLRDITNVVDLSSKLIIAESILFAFASDDSSFNKMFTAVDPQLHSMYDTMNSNPNAYTIDPMMFDKSNINRPNLSQFTLMTLIRRYMGRFFPAIFNSITCMSDFISTDGGVDTAELYTTSVT